MKTPPKKDEMRVWMLIFLELIIWRIPGKTGAGQRVKCSLLF
jgi:hypothetical protein